jgi:hypothetical protein
MGSMRKPESEREIIRIRSKGERLDVVKAQDQTAALKAALKLFELQKSEASRLLVRPSGC